MKHIPLFFLLLFFFSKPLIAQQGLGDCDTERYTSRYFENIKITSDITYGSYPADNLFSSDFTLELDFYEPEPNEEYLTKRPVVVLLFGGAFILGEKDKADMVAWGDSLAHHGYTVASVQYRLDNAVNMATNTSAAIRAAYRSIQDGRAAIRYLLEDPDGYGFNIDPDHIYVAGESAGAIAAIQIAFMEESERPEETYSGFLMEDLGCIDCAGNSFDQPFQVKGVLEMWGAALDTTFIDPYENIPVCIIHGTSDAVVLYDTGKPFLDFYPTMPVMYGAIPMNTRLDNLGIYNEFYPYPGEGHSFYGASSGIVTFPNSNWEPVFYQGKNFLYNTIKFDTEIPDGNLEVCEGDEETYAVTDKVGSTFCWEVVGGSIIVDNGNEITVRWDDVGMGKVNLTEETYIDVRGTKAELDINIKPSPAADFTYTQSGYTFAFTDMSVDADTWYWDFGDGFASTLQNPTYTYTSTPLATTLTVTNTVGCSNSMEVGFVSLPVELLEFNGTSTQKGHLLTWKTASETENSHFELEVSDDPGRSFGKLAVIEGRGNSMEIQEYDYLNTSSMSRTLYYRLKQVDYSGTYSYSDIVRVSGMAKDNFSVHPNPLKSNQSLNVYIPCQDTQQETEVAILDLNGKLVETYLLKSNNESIELNLQRGVYIITLQNSCGSFNERIVVE